MRSTMKSLMLAFAAFPALCSIQRAARSVRSAWKGPAKNWIRTDRRAYSTRCFLRAIRSWNRSNEVHRSYALMFFSHEESPRVQPYIKIRRRLYAIRGRQRPVFAFKEDERSCYLGLRSITEACYAPHKNLVVATIMSSVGLALEICEPIRE